MIVYIQLGSCSYTSYKGATCLHNAVCSGSQACIEYLIEMGCDINSQDDDGWFVSYYTVEPH